MYSVCVSLSLSLSLFLLPHLSHSEQLSYRFKLAIQFLNLLWSIFECRQHQKSKLQNKFRFFWCLNFLPNSNFSLLSEGRQFLLGQKFLPNFFSTDPFLWSVIKMMRLKKLSHTLSLSLSLNAHTHTRFLPLSLLCSFQLWHLVSAQFFFWTKIQKAKKE